MMRRSFGGGGGGGRNMGGGGGIMRTVQRAVRAGVGSAPPEPFSPSASTTTTTTIAGANSRKANNFNNKQKQPASPNAALTLSSSSSSTSNNININNNNNGTSAFSSLINFPISSSSPTSTCSDESEWECVDGSEEQRACFFYEDYVFGTVPSKDEVHHAVSALQQVFAPKGKLAEDTDRDVADENVANPIGSEKRISSAECEMEWIEPSMPLCNSKMLQHRGSDRVYDAFHLLETEPSVQRMVVSLSSDKAVWDAVLNNEVVKELRGSIYHKADSLIEISSDEGSDDDSNPVKDILSWIVVNGKAKIMQLIDKITQLVNEVLKVPNEEKKGDSSDPLEEKLRTSLFLSIVVLLVVVITRTKTV